MSLPENREQIFNLLAPLMEQSLTIPVTSEIVEAIRSESAEHLAGLPATIANRVYREGLVLTSKYEQIFKLPQGTLGDNNLLGLPRLYGLAPGHILEVERHRQSETVIEEVTAEAVNRGFIKNQQLGTAVYVAEAHIVLASYVQLMEDDPTGFKLVDRIAYGEPLKDSPLFFIYSQFPAGLRIVRVGAERYKKLYEAVSKQTPPKNP